MSVKLADTLAPMGEFPIGESKDIDIEINGTNKRLQQAYEDGDLGGSAIQVETLPIASEDELGKIYQYTGDSGTYQNGFFYRCDYDSENDEYVWTEIVYGSNLQAGDGIDITDDTISVKDRLEEVDELPTPTAELLDEKKCYLLRSEQTGFVRGSVYHVGGSEEQLVNGAYISRVGEGGLDDYVEYFDITGSHSDYNKKYTPKSNVVVLCKNFSPLTSYKEVAYFIAESLALRVHYADGSNDETFNYGASKLYIKALVDLAWIPSGTNLDFDSDNFDVADDTVSLNDGYKKIFTGTHAEWDELTLDEKKSYDEADFTDDIASGFPVISDVVADGDMNPVTSSAVANAIDELRNVTYQMITDTELTTTATDYTTYLGRKLSDYDYFIVQQYDSSSLRNAVVINLNQFKLKRVILSTLHGANTSNPSDYSVSGINVSYVDDTTINAYATGSAMINIVKIMGVKITR